MDVSPNPFAILTFISAPAVLANASCVLLFGTGNRYGCAIDRVHELADVVERKDSLDERELRLRIRRLSAAAGFVASTLVLLIGAVLVSTGIRLAVEFAFALAFLTGSLGVFAGDCRRNHDRSRNQVFVSDPSRGKELSYRAPAWASCKTDRNTE